MSGEVIAAWGSSWKVLQDVGISVANGAISQADLSSYDVVADGLSYPDAEFVFTGSFAVAPAENSTILLYARPLLVDGSLNSEVPETTRPTVFIGSFTLNNVTTLQAVVLDGIFATDLPQKAAYYIQNNGSGQLLASGWTLKVRPRTRKAAP